MHVLLDEQLPINLAPQLRGHAVETVAGRGWAGIKNGELLSRMRGHYDVLITMDGGIEFQHQISTLPFGIVVVRAPSNRMQTPEPARADDPRRHRRNQARPGPESRRLT